MAAFGRILWRLLVVFVGLVLASAASMAVVVMAVAQRFSPQDDPVVAVVDILLYSWFEAVPMIVAAGSTTAPVFVLAALVAEGFRLRDWLYHAGMGTLSAAVSTVVVYADGFAATPSFAVLLAAGAVAGLVYWLVAGRGAGFFRPMASQEDQP